MLRVITKDTAVSIGLLLTLMGAAAWAATVQADISHMKNDLVYIREKVETISARGTASR